MGDPNIATQTDNRSNAAAGKGNFHLFRVHGINVTINYSWLTIFALVAISLPVGFFSRYFPGCDYKLYWITGLVAALLFLPAS